MRKDSKHLLEKHAELNHLEGKKVTSHVQREEEDWVRHTIMLADYEVPFVFRRKQQYQSLKGARVNLTYYRHIENVSGIEFETMKVVRIKRT